MIPATPPMHRSRSTCAADYDFPPVPFAGLPSPPARTAAQLLLGDERTSPDQVKTCSRVDEGVAIGKVSVLQLSLVANTAWLVPLVRSGGGAAVNSALSYAKKTKLRVLLQWTLEIPQRACGTRGLTERVKSRPTLPTSRVV